VAAGVFIPVLPSPHAHRAPLPDTVVDRGAQRCVLHREGRHRAGARVFLFRGRARSALGGELLTRGEARRMAEGLGNKAIARELNVAEGTIKLHLNSICRKLASKADLPSPHY